MKKLIFLFAFVMFAIASVSAWENNTFNNSVLSEFISFPNAGSTIRYLSVPEGTILTNGQLNLTYPLGLTASESLIAYYDLSSDRERVRGIYNLSNNEGVMVYNNSNCVTEDCAQIVTNRNVRVPAGVGGGLNLSLTINFWVRTTNNTAPSADEYIFFSPASANANRIGISDSSQWFWGSWTGTQTNRTAPQANTYYMVTVTRNSTSGNITTYVNGLVEASSVTGNFTGGGALLLGANFNNASELANGQMDEVSFWNRTLTPSEINNLYTIQKSYVNTTSSDYNLNLSIGGVSISNTLTSNLSNSNNSALLAPLFSYVNNYLSTCTIVGGYCSVPFNFSTNVGGVWLLYNNLNFSDRGASINTNTFNASAYETSTQSFSSNISTQGLSSASLIYDGVTYSGATVTQVGSLNQYIVTKSIGIPLESTSTNVSWNWSLSYSDGRNIQTNPLGQVVNNINWSICNAGLTVPYLNITFKNESSGQQTVNATLSSSFAFWIDEASINRTYSFTSTFENSTYAFCGTPSSQPLNINIDSTYSNSLSSLRGYSNNLSVSNITTNVTLYLLANSVGRTVTFQVVTVGGSRIAGATITATRSGFGSVEQKTTDSAGIATFFLDSSASYTITVTASGYSSSTQTITPTQSEYTITLGSTSATVSPDYLRGIVYHVSPTGRELNNRTDYTFNFSITSNYWGLTSFGFVLKNNTGATLGSASASGSAGGSAASVINTQNNSFLIMNYFYLVNGTYINGTTTWIVVDEAGSGWSILNLVNRLKFYMNDSSDPNGLFGIKSNTSGGDFSLAIIIFIIIFTFAGIMSYNYGLQTPGAILGLIFALVLFFDVALGLVPTPFNNFPHFATFFMGFILVGELIREAST